MVRHKARWLLVKFENEESVKSISCEKIKKENMEEKKTPLNRKDIYHAIREVMEEAFGVATAGIIQDIEVRMYIHDTNLAMIKVPRDQCDLVRSTLMLMVEIKDIPIVARVVSTNGSARTAKLHAFKEIKRIFRAKNKNETHIKESDVNNLEEQFGQVRNLE